jgi:type IV pilus assembly protein PilA
MIVVAMVGVMSALAVVSYRKYVNAAQSSEAKAMIQGIRVGEEAYKSEMLVYLSCSRSLKDFYPQKPHDTKMNWVQPNDPRYTDPKNGWQLLNVQADGPVRFGYAVVAGVAPDAIPTPDIAITGWPPRLPEGTPWFVVQAQNQRPGSPRPVVFASSSMSSEIFAENDGE